MLGRQAPADRTLFWRYKINSQRAARSGSWKYLRINGNEFLFDVVVDQRERANLARRHPEVLRRLKDEWERWNAGMLPITEDVRSHGVNGKIQADHYHAEGTD
jgi:hypothetical protein